LTNSLPITPDKSDGFYRKWLILDFPNQFTNVKGDFTTKIPDVEFNNLAKKCLRILKELYDTEEFDNEGSFEDRAKRYEERSNPVMRFVENECEEEPGSMLQIRDFTNSLNADIKKNRLRPMSAIVVGKVLRAEGFVVGSRNVKGTSAVIISNLKLKTSGTSQTSQNLTSSLHRDSTQDLTSSTSSTSSEENIGISVDENRPLFPANDYIPSKLDEEENKTLFGGNEL
jgi:hypothetical protein